MVAVLVDQSLSVVRDLPCVVTDDKGRTTDRDRWLGDVTSGFARGRDAVQEARVEGRGVCLAIEPTLLENFQNKKSNIYRPKLTVECLLNNHEKFENLDGLVPIS